MSNLTDSEALEALALSTSGFLTISPRLKTPKLDENLPPTYSAKSPNSYGTQSSSRLPLQSNTSHNVPQSTQTPLQDCLVASSPLPSSILSPGLPLHFPSFGSLAFTKPASPIFSRSISSFDLVGTIANGSHCQLLVGNLRSKLTESIPAESDEGAFHAIKIYRKRDMHQDSVDQVKKELRALRWIVANTIKYNADKPLNSGQSFLQKMIETFQNEQYIFIVLDYQSVSLIHPEVAARLRLVDENIPGSTKSLSDSSLSTPPANNPFEHFSATLNTLRLVAAELALGLSFLHQSGLVHQDIKPSNILISSSGHVVISDFGASSTLPFSFDYDDDFPVSPAIPTTPGTPVYHRTNKTFHSIVLNPQNFITFTPLYAAPELTRPNRAGLIIYDDKVDFWSMGVTMYEVAMGNAPFMVPSPSPIMSESEDDDDQDARDDDDDHDNARGGTKRRPGRGRQVGKDTRPTPKWDEFSLAFDGMEGLIAEMRVSPILADHESGGHQHQDREAVLQLHSFIRALLVDSASDRLSDEQVKYHAFFEPVSHLWNEIAALEHPPLPAPPRVPFLNADVSLNVDLGLGLSPQMRNAITFDHPDRVCDHDENESGNEDEDTEHRARNSEQHVEHSVPSSDADKDTDAEHVHLSFSGGTSTRSPEMTWPVPSVGDDTNGLLAPEHTQTTTTTSSFSYDRGVEKVATPPSLSIAETTSMFMSISACTSRRSDSSAGSGSESETEYECGDDGNAEEINNDDDNNDEVYDEQEGEEVESGAEMEGGVVSLSSSFIFPSSSGSTPYLSGSFLYLDDDEVGGNGDVEDGNQSEMHYDNDDEDDGMTVSPIQPFPSTASLYLELPEEEELAFVDQDRDTVSGSIMDIGEIPTTECETEPEPDPGSDVDNIEIFWVPRPFDGPLHPSESCSLTPLPNPYSPQPPQASPHVREFNNEIDASFQSLNDCASPTALTSARVSRRESPSSLRLRTGQLDILGCEEAEDVTPAYVAAGEDNEREAEATNGASDSSSALGQGGEIGDIPDGSSLDHNAAEGEEDVDMGTVRARAVSFLSVEGEGRVGGVCDDSVVGPSRKSRKNDHWHSSLRLLPSNRNMSMNIMQRARTTSGQGKKPEAVVDKSSGSNSENNTTPNPRKRFSFSSSAYGSLTRRGSSLLGRNKLANNDPSSNGGNQLSSAIQRRFSASSSFLGSRATEKVKIKPKARSLMILGRTRSFASNSVALTVPVPVSVLPSSSAGSGSAGTAETTIGGTTLGGSETFTLPFTSDQLSQMRTEYKNRRVTDPLPLPLAPRTPRTPQNQGRSYGYAQSHAATLGRSTGRKMKMATRTHTEAQAQAEEMFLSRVGRSRSDQGRGGGGSVNVDISAGTGENVRTRIMEGTWTPTLPDQLTMAVLNAMDSLNSGFGSRDFTVESREQERPPRIEISPPSRVQTPITAALDGLEFGEVEEATPRQRCNIGRRSVIAMPAEAPVRVAPPGISNRASWAGIVGPRGHRVISRKEGREIEIRARRACSSPDLLSMGEAQGSAGDEDTMETPSPGKIYATNGKIGSAFEDPCHRLSTSQRHRSQRNSSHRSGSRRLHKRRPVSASGSASMASRRDSKVPKVRSSIKKRLLGSRIWKKLSGSEVFSRIFNTS